MNELINAYLLLYRQRFPSVKEDAYENEVMVTCGQKREEKNICIFVVHEMCWNNDK